MKKTTFLKYIAGYTVVLLLLMALAVFLIDPFFHYHKPWFGLKAVLTDKEYQCVGTLRTFDYDALIVGSSVTENNDNAWFDEDFGVTSIKAARSYGMTEDLCYLMDVARESHMLRYVFYNIDPAALANPAELTFASSGCPMYLYDKNPFNDVKYLWNKDVLFEKIPYMIARSKAGYDEGKSYNWAQWKVFGEADVLSHYYRKPTEEAQLPQDAYAQNCQDNLAALTARVEAHPETEYLFFFPPYSMLWWDTITRAGERDAYLYNERQAMETLLQYDNVTLYYFAHEEDWILDLDNYMDVTHFTAEINHAMEREMTKGEARAQAASAEGSRTVSKYLVTKENYGVILKQMRVLAEETIPERVAALEAEGRLLYDLE